jgi:serine/threonine-protein kinase
MSEVSTRVVSPPASSPASLVRDPVRELEKLWQQGERPDVREFLQKLTQTGEILPSQVVGALCVDQWQRWQQGERVPAEVYLQMHPGLAAEEEAFDLVYGEFLLREEMGEQPSATDFLKRFPQFAAQFQRQATVHRAIESGKPPEATVKHAQQSILGEQTDELQIEPAREEQWPTVPGYTILAKLGQGGMGQVFKALQTRLDRVVALKVIRQECLLQEPRAAARFQREAQAAAQLNHPNIIIVYDFNQVDDNYYIAMEYVEGIDLDQMVREGGPLPVERACDFIRQAALGLQHAHEEAGMVHRDIKPSNLLIAVSKKEAGISGYHPLPGKQKASGQFAIPRRGSNPSRRRNAGPGQEGVLKILDMGMALLLHTGDPDSAQTMQGTLMGTPDYIAPEQAMDSHQVDIRADLYSLGCTFYFLLCGKPPYAEYPLLKKLMMHQAGQPRLVRAVQPDVPVEVEAIVSKLMAKRPEDRFQTPGELATALEDLIQRKAAADVATPQDPDLQKILKNWQSSTPNAPVTEKSLEETRRGGTQEWTGRNERAKPAGPEYAAKVYTLKGHGSWVMTVAWSPNRRALATGPVNGNVRLWDITGRRPCERAILQTAQCEVHSLAFSPNNGLLAAGSGRLNGHIWLWDLTTPVPDFKAMLHGHTSPVEALAFSNDGTLLVSAGCDRTIRIWDVAAKEIKERWMFKGHLDHIKAVALAPDGKTACSASLDGTIRTWRRGGIWSRDMQEVIEGSWGPVHTMALSPDGNQLAFGGLDQTVRLYSLGDKGFQKAAVLRGHLGVIRQVRFSPEGKILASVCDGGRVIFWDLATNEKSREWQLPTAGVCSIALTLDTRYLAAGTSDGMVDMFRMYVKKKDGE